MTIYKLLLRLYPASFRNEYGAEMRAVFARRRQQVSGAGIAALTIRTAGEVIGNALAVAVGLWPLTGVVLLMIGLLWMAGMSGAP